MNLQKKLVGLSQVIAMAVLDVKTIFREKHLNKHELRSAGIVRRSFIM